MHISTPNLAEESYVVGGAGGFDPQLTPVPKNPTPGSLHCKICSNRVTSNQHLLSQVSPAKTRFGAFVSNDTQAFRGYSGKAGLFSDV